MSIRFFSGLNITAVKDRATADSLRDVEKYLRDLGPAIRTLETSVAGFSGSGGGAPSGASYLTAVAEAGLSDHRVLAVQAPITMADGGAGGAMTIGATFAGAPAVTYASAAAPGVATSLLRSDAVLQFPQALMPVSGGTDTLTLTQSGVDQTLTGTATGAFNIRPGGEGLSLPKWVGGGSMGFSPGTVLAFNALGTTMGGGVLNAAIQAEIAINEPTVTYAGNTYGAQLSVDTRSGPTYTAANLYAVWARMRATGSISGSNSFARRMALFGDLVVPMGASVTVTDSAQVYGEDNTSTLGTVGTYTNGYAAHLVFPRTGTTIRRGYNLRTQSTNRGTEATDTEGFYCETLQKGTTRRTGFAFEGATTGTPTDAHGFRQMTVHAVGTNRYGAYLLNASVLQNPSGVGQNVLTLDQLNTGATAGAHILFNDKAGDPTGLVAGQFWRNATNLKWYDGTVTGTLAVLEKAQTFTAGMKQTFGHNATNAGFNLNPAAGDPSTPANGDLWYNSSTGKFRKRQGGVTEDMDTTGAGAGPEFADNVFRITDNTDTSKKIAWEVSGVTTATTRTRTVLDTDGTEVLLSGIGILDPVTHRPGFAVLNTTGSNSVNIPQARAGLTGVPATIQPYSGSGDTSVDLRLGSLGTAGHVVVNAPGASDLNILHAGSFAHHYFGGAMA